MLEEMGDTLDQDFGQVGVVADVLVIGVQFLDRDGDDLFILSGLVMHDEHADGARAHDGAGNDRNAAHDQHVHRIAVFRERMRDEAVIRRILHRRVDEAVDEERARRLVHLVLHRMAAMRHLDDDVDVVGRVDADRYGLDTHLRFNP